MSSIWTKLELLHLIKIVGDAFLKSNGENNCAIFINAATKLFEEGYQKNYVQCKMKWKELLKEYNEKKNDKDYVQCFYFKDLHEVLLKIDKLNSAEYKRQWTEAETVALIKLIKNENLVDIEDDTIFEKISNSLEINGFKRRDPNDIKEHWKKLVSLYKKCIKGELIMFKYFALIDEILNWKNNIVIVSPKKIMEDASDIEINTICVRTKSQNWSHAETLVLLTSIKETGFPKIPKEKITEMFDRASVKLHDKGFKRSNEQCRLKFKRLKAKYFFILKKIGEDCSDPADEFPYFYKLHEIYSTETTCDDNYEIEYLDDDNNEFLVSYDPLPTDTSNVILNEDITEEIEVIVPKAKKLKSSKDNDDEKSVCNFKLDDIQHYCLSLSETFKRLPIRKQSKLKIEIQKLLYRAEFDDNF